MVTPIRSGDRGLGQAQGLAALGEAMAVDVGLVALSRLGDGFLAAESGDDLVPGHPAT